MDKKLLVFLFVLIVILLGCKERVVKPIENNSTTVVNLTTRAHTTTREINTTTIQTTGFKNNIPKEAEEFVASLIFPEIPDFFDSPSNINRDFALKSALFFSKSYDLKNDKFYFCYINRADVDKTAKELFNSNIAIQHKSISGYIYDQKKLIYKFRGFGFESGYILVSTKFKEGTKTLSLYGKIIYSNDETYYENDEKTLLGNDLKKATSSSKSIIYKITLTKKSNGGFYFTAFEKG